MSQFAQSGWIAYGAAVLIGIPLYVCDGGEVPLTLALLEAGVGTGPAFTFLLASVGTCFPTIMMASRIIGWGATMAYLATWLIMAIGGGMIITNFG